MGFRVEKRPRRGAVLLHPEGDHRRDHLPLELWSGTRGSRQAPGGTVKWTAREAHVSQRLPEGAEAGEEEERLRKGVFRGIFWTGNGCFLEVFFWTLYSVI